MKQGFMDYLQKLKEETIASLHDIEEAWEELEEEFDIDDDSTDEPRLYCSRIAGTLTETSDELSTFKPSQFHSKVGMEVDCKEEEKS